MKLIAAAQPASYAILLKVADPLHEYEAVEVNWQRLWLH